MNITVDFLDVNQLKSVRASATRLFKKIVSCKAQTGGNFRELIWPALETPINPELILVPLDRVGAEQGFGGCHVMIGYFAYRDNRRYPSHPLVVKVSKPSIDGKTKLRREWQSGNRIRSYIAYHKDSFAQPLHFDELPTGRPAVLWSPFSSSEWIWNETSTKGKKLTLKVCDLWRVLRRNYIKVSGTPDCDPAEILKTVYRVTKPLHERVGSAKSVKSNLLAEYKRYLRHFNKNTGWGKSICQMWKDEAVTEMAGTFLNPIRCLERLKTYKSSLRFGAVHGDLHPRNVVITDNKSPRIIDFGWSSDNEHIAKDFVLMECNLRFVALRPDVGWRDLNLMTNWIGFDEEPPKPVSEEIAGRIKLIQELRAIARSRFPDKTDWDNEYVIPLFLVSFGLLSVWWSMDNQLAARTTVLKLSNYIQKKFHL